MWGLSLPALRQPRWLCPQPGISLSSLSGICFLTLSFLSVNLQQFSVFFVKENKGGGCWGVIRAGERKERKRKTDTRQGTTPFHPTCTPPQPRSEAWAPAGQLKGHLHSNTAGSSQAACLSVCAGILSWWQRADLAVAQTQRVALLLSPATKMHSAREWERLALRHAVRCRWALGVHPALQPAWASSPSHRKEGVWESVRAYTTHFTPTLLKSSVYAVKISSATDGPLNFPPSCNSENSSAEMVMENRRTLVFS